MRARLVGAAEGRSSVEDITRVQCQFGGGPPSAAAENRNDNADADLYHF